MLVHLLLFTSKKLTVEQRVVINYFQLFVRVHDPLTRLARSNMCFAYGR